MSDIHTNGYHHSGQPGVNWDKAIKRWRVSIPRDGSQLFLGAFDEDDKILAIAMRQEAERLPTEELPALKERYGFKSRRRNAPPIITGPEDTLIALYRQALDADARLRDATLESTKAANHAHAVEEESIAAWNAFADALKETGRNIDSGFVRSKLGLLLDREES